MSDTNMKCDREILESEGWHPGYQNFMSCPICHHGGHDFFGWRSPGYKFYHDSVSCERLTPAVRKNI